MIHFQVVSQLSKTIVTEASDTGPYAVVGVLVETSFNLVFYTNNGVKVRGTNM